MPDDDSNPQFNALLPDAVWPLEGTPPLIPLDYNTPWPQLEDPPNTEFAKASQFVVCSTSNPYVMRSKRNGSVNPTDDTAALSVDQANPDTWDRANPPVAKTTMISAISTGGTVTITANGNLLPATGGYVTLSGTNSTPAVNGKFFATYVNANQFTIVPQSAVTVSGTTGSVAVLTNGVSIGPEQRHYKYNSSLGTYEEKVFARLKKWDSCGELYYIGPEVIIQTATIAGSGSASGGFP